MHKTCIYGPKWRRYIHSWRLFSTFLDWYNDVWNYWQKKSCSRASNIQPWNLQPGSVPLYQSLSLGRRRLYAYVTLSYACLSPKQSLRVQNFTSLCDSFRDLSNPICDLSVYIFFSWSPSSPSKQTIVRCRRCGINVAPRNLIRSWSVLACENG